MNLEGCTDKNTQRGLRSSSVRPKFRFRFESSAEIEFRWDSVFRQKWRFGNVNSVAARLDFSISRFLDNFELLVSRVDFSSRLVSRNSGQNGFFMA